MESKATAIGMIEEILGMDSRHYRRQEAWDWCGPAAIQMMLATAEINTRQAEIAAEVFDAEWGTSHEAMVGYLQRHFVKVESGPGNTVDTLEERLRQGYEVIVNWWDDFPTELKNDPPDGHYCPVRRVLRRRQGDREWREIEFYDPAQVKRKSGKNGIYSLTEAELT